MFFYVKNKLEDVATSKAMTQVRTSRPCKLPGPPDFSLLSPFPWWSATNRENSDVVPGTFFDILF